jgi:hypothetical protein
VDRTKADPYRCYCTPAAPPDANEFLSSVMGSWNKIALDQLPKHTTRRPKQKGYKPTAEGASLLFQKASSMRNLLKVRPPTST